MYFSRKANVDRILQPSDWLEYASCCMLGEVPALVHISVSLVTIFHEKVLWCCALSKISLMMMIFPLFCLIWFVSVLCLVVGFGTS